MPQQSTETIFVPLAHDSYTDVTFEQVEALIDFLTFSTLAQMNAQWVSEDPQCREEETKEFFKNELAEAELFLEELAEAELEAQELSYARYLHRRQ